MNFSASALQPHPIFGSVSTAMVTPMKADGAVDFEAAEALADYLVAQGNDALVVSGTTGETSTLEDQEKEDLFRAVVQAVSGRATVIAGTGTNHTSHSIEMARRAAAAGVDAQLVVTPYYNKPTQSGVFAHFEAIAGSSDLPIMIYDIPGRAGISISTETLVRLSALENVMALKDAKGDLVATSEVLSSTDLAVYSGEDALTLPLLSLGARGVVSVTAHVAAPLFRKMIDAACAGDFTEARVHHRRLEPVVRAVMTHVQGAMSAKFLLAEAGVIPCAHVRLPLVEGSEAELAPVIEDMAASGWTIASIDEARS